MKHIAILNPKGGCGKTTIATHLAVYASTLGLDVALADHDVQHSSLDWMKSRPSRCADIDIVASYRGDALGRDYDVVIHDMPGGDFGSVQLPLDICSKIIIPLMPSPIDLKAALQLWIKLSEQGWLDNPNIEFGIVANRVKSNTKYIEVFDTFISKIEIPRIATLRDTQNYIRAMDGGLTLFDLPPGRVVKDLMQWEPLMEWSGFFDMDEDMDALLEAMLAEERAGGTGGEYGGHDRYRELVAADDGDIGSAGGAASELDSDLLAALSALANESEASPAKPVDSARSQFLKSQVETAPAAGPASGAVTGQSASDYLGADNTAYAAGQDYSFSDDYNDGHVDGYGQRDSYNDGYGESADGEHEFVSLDDYQAEQLEEEAESADYPHYE